MSRFNAPDSVQDFGRCAVGFAGCWRLSGNLAADITVFAARLQGVRGLHPSLAAPVRPL